MYFTDDAMFGANQEKLIICAAPYGPVLRKSDFPEDVVESWDEQVQKAVDCYNAGATVLHVHLRDPKSGKASKDINMFAAQIARLREAVPKMILQVGGSISFAPEPGQKAHFPDLDTRHMLAALEPKPDQVTIQIYSASYDVLEMATPEDVKGMHLADPEIRTAYGELVNDATPTFFIEHLKRLRENNIQPLFMMCNMSHLEAVERLIRRGLFMGPMSHMMNCVGGGSFGRHPADIVEYIRRSPQGSNCSVFGTLRGSPPIIMLAMILGVHVRCGIEENWISPQKNYRWKTVEQIEWVVKAARHMGREIATGEDARRILKIGVQYNSVEETLLNLGLPPNRKGEEKGFLLPKTDGKRYIMSEDRSEATA